MSGEGETQDVCLNQMTGTAETTFAECGGKQAEFTLSSLLLKILFTVF